MKKTIIIYILTTCFMTSVMANENERAAVKKTINAFATAADTRDIEGMDRILDENFRVVMNRLFGSDKVSILNKDAYITMLREKKLGGDKNEVAIHAVEIEGNNAYASTTFTGNKLTMKLYLHLVRSEAGTWHIVDDLPSIIK